MWGTFLGQIQDNQELLYVFLVILFLINTYPVVLRYHEHRKVVRKEQFDAVVGVFSDQKLRSSHFLVEQVIENKFGKAIPYRDVEYMLQMNSPSEALRAYIGGFALLDSRAGMKQPSYRGLYSLRWYRRLMRGGSLILYFVTSFASSAESVGRLRLR